jgi:hypothetical protein
MRVSILKILLKKSRCRIAAVMAVLLLLILGIVFRVDTPKRVGIVALAYSIAQYEPALSENGRGDARERWFSCGWSLAKIRMVYSIMFGLKFNDDAVWRQAFELPHDDKIGGRRYRVYDYAIEVTAGYSLRLYEGCWLDNPECEKIVLMGVYNGF